MPTLIANYEKPRQLFNQLWQVTCQQRILLWQGESGSGKTELIEHCLDHLPKDSFYVHIPIQSALSVTEIFYWIVHFLGTDSLSTFAHLVARLTDAPEVKIDSNWLAGINNRISVSLHTDNLQEQERRQSALTHALFNDLEKWQTPVLFVFDTFEKATTSVADWVQGPFLSRVFWTQTLRTVVAGQSVPDRNNTLWGKGCAYYRLKGIPEAEAWLPLIKDRVVPYDQPIGFLAGICQVLEGQPWQIRPIIDGLPLREVPQ